MPLDITRDDWRLIPNDVMDTEAGQEAAQQWGDQQQKQIGSKWAEIINRGLGVPGFQTGYNGSGTGGFVGGSAVLQSPGPSLSQGSALSGAPAPFAPPVPLPSPADQGDRAVPPAASPQSPSGPSDQSDSGELLPPTTTALSGGVPKTVSQTGGVFYGLGDRGMAIARAAGDEARQRGFGDDGARALQAILLTEGGLTGARGDYGASAGPLQFYGKGGMLNEFAKQNNMSESDAADYVEQNPLEAVRWALGTQDKPGYLGSALKYAQGKGMTGADLATYAQKNGQRSVSPERAGQWYNTLFANGQDPFSAPITAGAAGAIGGTNGATYGNPAAVTPSTGMGVANAKEGRGAYANQFQLGLSDQDAYAACGPAAAIAFARANGRNPTTDEAMQLAKSVGWNPNQGMAGVASEQGLLNKLGISTKLETTVDWSHVQQDASGGNPVVLSTPGHYFFIDDYDPDTRKYHVGASGTAMKQGAEWMSSADIGRLGGGLNGALYADHPQAEGSSITESQPPVSQPDVSYDRKEARPAAGFVGASADVAQKANNLQNAVQNAGGQQLDAYGRPLTPGTGPNLGDIAAGVGRFLTEPQPWMQNVVGAQTKQMQAGLGASPYEPGQQELSPAEQYVQARGIATGLSQTLLPEDLIARGATAGAGSLSESARVAKGLLPGTGEAAAAAPAAPVAADAAERAAAAAAPVPESARAIPEAMTAGPSQAAPNDLIGQINQLPADQQQDVQALIQRMRRAGSSAAEVNDTVARVVNSLKKPEPQVPTSARAIPESLVMRPQEEGAVGFPSREAQLSSRELRDQAIQAAEPGGVRGLNPDEVAPAGAIAQPALAEHMGRIQRQLDTQLDQQYPGLFDQGPPPSLSRTRPTVRIPSSQVPTELMDEAARTMQRNDATAGGTLDDLVSVDKRQAAAESAAPSPAPEATQPPAEAAPAGPRSVQDIQADIRQLQRRISYQSATASGETSRAGVMPSEATRLKAVAARHESFQKLDELQKEMTAARSGTPYEPPAAPTQPAPSQPAAPAPTTPPATPASPAQRSIVDILKSRAGPGDEAVHQQLVSEARNWLQGSQPGQVSPVFAIRTAGAVAGGVAGNAATPGDADAWDRARNILVGAAAGGGLAYGATGGLRQIANAVRQGGWDQDAITQGMEHIHEQFNGSDGLASRLDPAQRPLADQLEQQALDGFRDLVVQRADPAQIARYFAGVSQTATGGPNTVESMTNWIRTLRTGSMAGGLSTLSHVAMNTLVQPAMRGPTSAAEAILAGHPERIPAGLVGSWKGLTAGAEDMLQTMRYGISRRAALTGELPLSPGLQTDNPIAQGADVALSGLMRTHGAAQDMMSQIGRYASLEQDAWSEATRLGLQGNAFTQHVANVLANPTQEMLTRAMNNGQQWGLRGPGYGQVGQTLESASHVFGLGGAVLPFLRIAYSGLVQGVERSPVGLLGTAADVARAPLGSGPYAAGAANAAVTPLRQRLINNAFGVGLAGLGYELAQQGILTGEHPDGNNPKWSVQIGGNWVPIRMAGPLSIALEQAAALHDGVKTGNGDVGAMVRNTASSFVAGAADQTFLRGFGDLIDAARGMLSGQERPEVALGTSMAKSFVPQYAATKQIGDIVDQPRVAPSTGNLPLDIGNKVLANVPGFRQNYQTLAQYQASPQGVRAAGFQSREQQYQQALDKQIAQLHSSDAYRSASPQSQRVQERKLTDTMARLYKMPMGPTVGAP